jgi:hypothetical protein
MDFITWVTIIAIVLVVIGLGVGVFFSGLFRGAEIVGERLQDNQVVQQAQEDVKDLIGDQITGTSSETLVMTTSKAAYDAGEPVTFTVKNIGDRTLEFPDASLGLEIENKDTGERFSVMAAQVITELSPDESKDVTWDEEAPGGDYVATVETTDRDVSAEVEFKIK